MTETLGPKSDIEQKLMTKQLRVEQRAELQARVDELGNKLHSKVRLAERRSALRRRDIQSKIQTLRKNMKSKVVQEGQVLSLRKESRKTKADTERPDTLEREFVRAFGNP